MDDVKQRLEELDAVLNALAHPARRHILLVVWFRGGEMSAGDIAGRFGCTWPTTSRHLKLLVLAGLLEVEKQGRTRIYKVCVEKFKSVQDWFGWFDASKNKDSPVTGKKLKTKRKSAR